MNISLLFFASFRETLDCNSLELQVASSISVEQLCLQLAEKGERWQLVFGKGKQNVKVAVNQELVDFNYQLQANDEVAFFPPVTGG